MTKKTFFVVMLAILIAVPLLVEGLGYTNRPRNFYGNGYGNGNGNGYGNGTGPIFNLLSGTPFTYNGTVVALGLNENHMTLSTGAGNIDFFGLGPLYYWDSQKTEKPEIGDTVMVAGYTIDYNGVPRNILFRVDVGGVSVQLRDNTTGYPLWRSAGGFYGRGNGNGNGNGNGYGRGNGVGNCGNRNYTRLDILSGTPFNYTGDIVSGGSSNCGLMGEGIVIATATGNVTVEGLGPWFFWDKAGIERPGVGDHVVVTGYTVNYNGSILNILMNVTIDGQTIQLRDAQTGLPLWWNSASNN